VRNDLVSSPKFGQEIWGKYEETMRGAIRTNNCIEGAIYFLFIV
jgi:hypothetical protein